MVLPTYFREFEVPLKIISGDRGSDFQISVLKKILKNYIEDVIFGAVDILSTGSLLIIIYHMINSCGDFVCTMKSTP